MMHSNNSYTHVYIHNVMRKHNIIIVMIIVSGLLLITGDNKVNMLIVIVYIHRYDTLFDETVNMTR